MTAVEGFRPRFRCTGLLAMIIVLSYRPDVSSSSRIILMPNPYRSHVNEMSSIGRGLIDWSGHDVRIVLPESYPELDQFEVTWPRLNVIAYKVRDPDFYTMVTTSDDWIDVALESDPVTELRTNVDGFLQFCTNPLGDQDFIRRLGDERFDLAIVDAFPGTRCYWILAHLLQLPYVSLSGQYEPWLMRAPAVPSFVPFSLSGWGMFTERMTFTERVRNLVGLFDWSAWPRLEHVEDEFVRRHLPVNSTETYSSLAARSLLWLIDTDVAMDFARPMMPNEINIGGLLTGPSKPLDDPKLKSFADTATSGLIIVSFGTVDIASERFFDEFLAAFKQLAEFRIVWRYSGKIPASTTSVSGSDNWPDNLLLMTWLPQNDLLGHTNTKLFISHCGANSQQEAVYHGVPLICLPVWGDQPSNAARMNYLGYGVNLGRMRDVTSCRLVAAARDVIANRSFGERARAASLVFRSRDQTPGQRAVWWIDHVIKHGGRHLHSYGVDMPWYQYLMLDILAVFVLLPIVVLTSSVTAFLCYCCCSHRRRERQHIKQN